MDKKSSSGPRGMEAPDLQKDMTGGAAGSSILAFLYQEKDREEAAGARTIPLLPIAPGSISNPMALRSNLHPPTSVLKLSLQNWISSKTKNSGGVYKIHNTIY